MAQTFPATKADQERPYTLLSLVRLSLRIDMI